MLDGYTRFAGVLEASPCPCWCPGIAATAVFALIFSWNEFVFAIFLTSSQDVRTAPPAIAGLIGGTTVDWGLVAASAMVFAASGARVRLPGAQAPRRRRDARGGATLMAGIEVTSLHKRFPDGTVAVEHVDLSIGDGELFVMLGPSGCGKTTTLRADRRAGAADVGRHPHRQHAGQRPAARPSATSPWCSSSTRSTRTCRSRDNLAFPLRAEGLPEDEVRERVDRGGAHDAAGALLDRRPQRLSGGEQQRVALARALVRRPQAFLMDEPLTNLDAELRADMRTEIKHLQAELGTTMVYVTHDQVEAMSLGHRIAILNKGRVEQVGTPLEVYDRPASLFCAAFIGSPPMNLIEVEVADGALRGPGGLTLPPPPGLPRDRALVAGVRPEALEVTRAGRGTLRRRPGGVGGGAGRRDHLRRRPRRPARRTRADATDRPVRR